MKTTRLGAGVALALLLLAPVAAQDAQMELQRAIRNETVSGDLKAAIAEYRRIAFREGIDRGVRARALLRLAEAHRKAGDAEARTVYERVVKEYADLAEAAGEARAGLAALTAPSPRGGRTARQLWVGADTMGSPSGDGRYVSFTDWSTGDLAVRDLAAGTSRRLTSTGGWVKSGDFAELSAMSPDGRYVAYAWFTERGTKDHHYDLRLMPLSGDGAKPRVLHPSQANLWIAPRAWTPDGKYVIALRTLARGSAEIVAIAVADGATRVVTKAAADSARRVSISPDARYLAFDGPAGPRGTPHDLFIVSFDGSGSPVQIPHPADDGDPMWTSDGTRILFLSDRSGRVGLWEVGVSAGRVQGNAQLVDQDVSWALGLTRTGALYYVTGGPKRNVYIAPVSGDLMATGAATVFTDRAVNSARGGAWSADGQYFAYYADRGVGRRPSLVSVVIRTAKTGEEREVAPAVRLVPTSAAGLRWFPDGRALLVSGPDAAGQQVHYRLDVVTGQAQPLARSGASGPAATHPSLSPDGRTIFYIDRAEGATNRIVRLNLESRAETELASGVITAVALSPDGGQLAFLRGVAESPSRDVQLVVMPANGGDGRVVHQASNWYDGSRFGSLGWSNDGRFILFVEPSGESSTSTLWRVPASGGPAQKTGISATGRIKVPAEVPGGGRLTYSVVEEGSAELWVLENFLTRRRSGS